ncbi:hypothetical protein SAMN05421810_105398 [Amycolatopsis arida]|uniref:Lipoprotein n=1 Tax=Amycolatopsis arida TaxID=587909 RepID=A0A1I5X2F9_9PSEU|nr:hypothetical protein [Amycolatopsis arida]TDX92572.1 hypothetical protein CLV69_105417 [Amycolatopsis arida]SFQ26149.1 hypothetical protein SAMN05421810_105398 [Amycolatopsis arida]
MSTRIARRRLVALVAGLGLLAALLTGCGAARPGTAVPDGDEAAAYVSAKFAETLKGLASEFTGNEPRKSKLDKYLRIDDKWIDSTITAVQVGRPPTRLSKNHSNKNSDEYLDVFHPAGSPVEYLLLGPAYASLAPTPWVSTPYTGAHLSECYWAGYQDVCKMLTAVSRSVDQGHAAKQAKSFPDGSVELTAEVPLRIFLEERVVVIPENLVDRLTEEMRSEPIATTVSLDPEGGLRQIAMTAEIAGPARFEVRMTYQVLDPPTEADLPKVPAEDQVTVLPDEAAVRDFYDRMGELQEGG